MEMVIVEETRSESMLEIFWRRERRALVHGDEEGEDKKKLLGFWFGKPSGWWCRLLLLGSLVKFRMPGDEELCFAHIKFERFICYPHGSVKKAVGYKFQISREVCSRDGESGKDSFVLFSF